MKQISDKQSSRPEESKVTTVKTVSQMAPEFEPIEQVAHSEIFAAPDSPKLKPAPRAVAFDTEQAPILAHWWFNTPLQDGLFTVNAMYQEIKKTVIKYHLEHNDAFYSQYPELLVLKDGEDPSTWSNEYLRINHREFDRRLAHLIWHYHNACCMLIGSAANMCLLAQISGSGKYRDLGEAFKIGRINNILNRYASFFKCVGIEDYIIEHSRFATGFTTYNSVIAAFPLWITDCQGNRGFGSANWTEIFDGVKATGNDVNQISATSQDYESFTELQKNMDIVRAEFIRDDIVEDPNDGTFHHANRVADANQKAILDMSLDSTKYKHTTPSMSKIENAATITFTDSEHGSFTVRADSSTEDVYESATSVKVGSNAYVTHDNLINRVWDTLNYWLEYIETYFNKFSQPTSQLVHFCQEHGWIDKKTMTGAAMFTRIKSQALSKPYDMKSIREEMIYKRDNDVTTATQIKFMPIIDRYYGSWKDPVDFDRNFNRYQVDLDDPVGIVLKAREFPSLTPVIYHDLGYRDDEGANEPHVSNGICSGSTQVDCTNDATLYPLHGILGKYASFLDYASSSHEDAEETAIESIALDSKVIESYIKKANGIVPCETMDYPRAFCQPLIDRTDPFQCGFNVVMFHDSKTQNEFERFFKDADRYEKRDTGSDTKFSYTPPTGGYPSSPAFLKDTDGKYQQMSLLNSQWCESNRYQFLFVGDSIWYLPENIPSQIGAGNYDEEFARGSFEPATSNLQRELNTFATALSTASTDQAAAGDCFNFNSRNTNDPKVAIAAGVLGALMNNKRYFIAGANTTLSKNLIIFLFGLIKNSSDGAIDTCLFNPLYGAVDIRKYDTPYLGAAMLMGMMGLYDADKTTKDPQIKINTCRLGVTPTGYYSIGENLAKVAYDSYRSIAQFLVWPIDQIHVKKTLRAGRRLFVPEKEIELSGFSGAAKMAHALLSRSRVMYTGAEDTAYLNSIPSDKLKNFQAGELGAGSPLDFGGLIEPPAIREAHIPNKSSFSAYNKPKVIKTASASSDNYSKHNSEGAKEMRFFNGSDKKFNDSRRPNQTENKSAGKTFIKKNAKNGKPKSTDQDKVLDQVEKIEESVNQNASDSSN